MGKKIFILILLFALLFTFVPMAIAEDVDIDIEIIGQIGLHRRGALTPRWMGVDLFSPSAERINEALNRQAQVQWDAAMDSLFEIEQIHQAVDVAGEVTFAASDSLLFATPVSFGSLGTIEEESSMPIWLIVLFLLTCAVGGFLIARAVIRKRGG